MDLIVKAIGRQCKFCAPSYSATHKLLVVAIATCIEWLLMHTLTQGYQFLRLGKVFTNLATKCKQG